MAKGKLIGRILKIAIFAAFCVAFPTLGAIALAIVAIIAIKKLIVNHKS